MHSSPQNSDAKYPPHMRRRSLLVLTFVALLLASCRTFYIGPNPASMLRNEQQAQGIQLTASPEDSLRGLLYELRFSNDYKLDEMLRSDVRGLKDFARFAGTKILSTSKVLVHYKKLKVGCTAFVCTSPDGDILYARNFDFTSAGPSPVVVTHTAPPDGYRSVSIVGMSLLNYPEGSLSDGRTDLSLLAVAPYLLMDGMNEKGLAISVLYLDARDTVTGNWYGGTEQYDRRKHDLMTTTAMRLVLDRAATVGEALALLGNYNMFANGKNPDCSYHFLLADSTGQSVVLEYVPQNGAWQAMPVATNLATNFYVHPELYGVGHGHDRFYKAQAALQDAGNVLTESEAMAVLQSVAQRPTAAKTSNTQWSVVYNLTRGTYTLCVGRKYEWTKRGSVE